MDIDKYPYRIVKYVDRDGDVLYMPQRARKHLFWTSWQNYGTHLYGGHSSFRNAVEDIRKHIKAEKEEPAIVYLDFEGNNVQK